MPPPISDTVNVLVPVGALGAGVSADDVARGIELGAHAIACDAGSTDSGPAYLATGRCKYARAAIKADLTVLMRAQAEHGIPLLIGSCGTSGNDIALDWTCDIALEIAREENLGPRIALLYSEQDRADIAAHAAAGRVLPLAPAVGADPALFRECDHIVALMGPEPYVAALRGGADIVLGGRTTDTAVLAAVPLMRGSGAAAAWHAAKIAECGGLCTENGRNGGVLIRVGQDHFDVEPLAPDNRCTPYSVSAHMLYENADPFQLVEPGGVLNVTAARYEQLGDRVVRSAGATFEGRPYTMKLEGASSGKFQTLMLVGIRDPKVLAQVDRFVARMHSVLEKRVEATMGPRAGDFSISLRAYGWNALAAPGSATDRPAPHEIGLMFVATAATQAVATEVAKACNPWFFHLPLEDSGELPSYAFPFSPAEIERGQVYEFRLNHVLAVSDPLQNVRTRFIDAGPVK